LSFLLFLAVFFFLRWADVDGALVGGASLDADQFKTIIQAARAATAE